MNGIVKIPMQFFILLIGVLILTFYQFNQTPVFFNEYEIHRLEQSVHSDSLNHLRQQLQRIQQEKGSVLAQYQQQPGPALQRLNTLQMRTDDIRKEVKGLVKVNGGSENDTNYVFLRFVMDHLPVGLVGLIIAIIF